MSVPERRVIRKPPLTECVILSAEKSCEEMDGVAQSEYARGRTS